MEVAGARAAQMCRHPFPSMLRYTVRYELPCNMTYDSDLQLDDFAIELKWVLVWVLFVFGIKSNYFGNVLLVGSFC